MADVSPSTLPDELTAAPADLSKIHLLCDDTNVGENKTKQVTLDNFTSLSVVVETAVVASATQSQGQQQVSGNIVVVETVATTDDVITLPPATAGRPCKVINAAANRLQVYPDTDDAIDGQAADTSVTIAPGTSVEYSATDAINWYS